VPDEVFVHSAGLCESEQVGVGTRIWAFAHVMRGAVLGTNCNICDHAFIETGARLGNGVTVKNAVLVWDGVVVEDDVFLGPGTVFTNELRPRAARERSLVTVTPTIVARGATLGANVTIVCGTRIGELAFVAAGSVVVDDVPRHAFVAGNPARQRGWVCECGSPLDAQLACVCGRVYATSVSDAQVGLVAQPHGVPSVSATAAGGTS
jgi:UDP-2-acetamido-3-amino-2,3-dideoxy-glucuronate N-acetyltransferase